MRPPCPWQYLFSIWFLLFNHIYVGNQIERLRAKEREQRMQQSDSQTASSSSISSAVSIPNTPLRDYDYKQFMKQLQHLTINNEQIKAAMGFAYDKVESAREIMTLLKESLCIATTSIPSKIARLYLLSDILHNSGAPVKQASSYRFVICFMLSYCGSRSSSSSYWLCLIVGMPLNRSCQNYLRDWEI
jgi:hypothetical protein